MRAYGGRESENIYHTDLDANNVSDAIRSNQNFHNTLDNIIETRAQASARD